MVAAKRATTLRRERSGAEADRRPKVSGTISNPDLLPDGDDRQFREMISLFYASATRVQVMRRAFARALALSSAEFGVVMALLRLEQNGGVRIRHLADHLHVAAANVTATVAHLERTGWVVKRADPSDSRAVGVQLTGQGRARIDAFSSKLHTLNDVWFEGMSFDEMRTVVRFLTRIIHNYPAAFAVARALDTQSAPDGKAGARAVAPEAPGRGTLRNARRGKPRAGKTRS